ncbi:MAG: relaxase/mobilization nuclease domain-containing protein [Saccharofermentans sp.]|nr:relaxase/mobilization nuclease domain-containing protein [Saccharofermentans sp.]
MAVTSIWAVVNHVDKTISYIVNPEKTTDKPELSADAIAARKAVGDVINYASNADKTEQMMFVTGINCMPETAADDFMETKRFWGKTGGRLAYHGYQSFLEGDGKITAEKAHEIGVKLAQELWGDRFEVVVATHLNTGHYHNHFCVNSVSFVDGIKYRRTPADYKQMKMVNDRLCQEAQLHVVENKAVKKGKSYDEWRAERQGRSTVRGTIREDIDYAIKFSRSEREFAKTMLDLGYEFKFVKPDGTPYEHPGIKPPGAKGFFRLRSLGDGYSVDSIRKRIIENTIVPGTPLIPERYAPISLNRQAYTTGLASMYRRYCIKIYLFISSPKKAKRQYIPMALREDIAKLDKYIEQMNFLNRNKIEDTLSLHNTKDEIKNKLNVLVAQRRKLFNTKKKAIRNNFGPLITSTNKEISDVTREIRELRNQLKMCDAVLVSSDKIQKNLNEPTIKSTLRRQR